MNANKEKEIEKKKKEIEHNKTIQKAAAKAKPNGADKVQKEVFNDDENELNLRISNSK